MNIGFFSALSGLQAAQRQLDTSSHNVSNANTEGYSRQAVSQTENQPFGMPGTFVARAGAGDIGTGVTIAQIARIRDQFIDRQVRTESATLGESQVSSNMLKQIEDIFGEPSDLGLASLMQKYFDGWHDLAGNPANTALRLNLRQQAVNLANGVQNLYVNLTLMRNEVNDRIVTTVDDINGMTKQIADLNKEIKASIAAGQRPNDLLDKQDLLLEKLSQKINIQVEESPSTGGRSVYVSGQPLVQDTGQFALQTNATLANGYVEIDHPALGKALTIGGGEIKALLDTRDIYLSDSNSAGFIKQLNDLAAGLITNVNALHTTGFGLTGVTSQNFFDGTNASDITVNANIVNDTALANGLDVIAAAANDPGSLTGGVGDSGIAVKIAQLREGKFLTGNSQTFDDFYKGMITNLGLVAQDATRRTDTQDALVKSIKDRRDQVSGVSTDEEMANVVRFQKAYAASARVMTTLTEMLDTLINLGK